MRSKQQRKQWSLQAQRDTSAELFASIQRSRSTKQPTQKNMNLTDDEIRIKVAESLGWVQIWKRQCGHNLGAPGAFDWVGREKPGGVEYVLPNYLLDLNVCAEFEKTLTDEEWDVYEDSLIRMVNSGHIKVTRCRLLISAHAHQRCIAFLKVKGILP